MVDLGDYSWSRRRRTEGAGGLLEKLLVDLLLALGQAGRGGPGGPGAGDGSRGGERAELPGCAREARECTAHGGRCL